MWPVGGNVAAKLTPADKKPQAPDTSCVFVCLNENKPNMASIVFCRAMSSTVTQKEEL